jgi:histidinol-phosphatase (PHP family)
MSSMPADYHMHTPLCRHARGEPTEYAARAEQLGLTEIGFSDHSPMPRDDFDDWRMRLADLDDYVAKVETARREHPALRIKLALEVDYFPDGEDWIKELARRHAWDYLIGSVHYVSTSWAIDSPFQVEEWKKRDTSEVWKTYCERLTEAARSGLFDIIAHADLCKKFSFYPPEEPREFFRPFLAAANGAGVAMELNTGGLRKDCREIYPSAAIVRLAFEAGVPITFGSDAHAPEEVGFGFDEALRIARAAGYTRWMSFDRRKKTEREL